MFCYLFIITTVIYIFVKLVTQLAVTAVTGCCCGTTCVCVCVCVCRFIYMYYNIPHTPNHKQGHARVTTGNPRVLTGCTTRSVPQRPSTPRPALILLDTRGRGASFTRRLMIMMSTYMRVF